MAPIHTNSPATTSPQSEFGSGQLGMDPWDGGDLNHKLAQRCLQAHRNVLRVLIGAASGRADARDDRRVRAPARGGRTDGQWGSRTLLPHPPRAVTSGPNALVGGLRFSLPRVACVWYV